MNTVLAPNVPASVVLAIESQLKADMSPLQSRVTALRILVCRFGEQDAWAWWPSQIWSRGRLAFSRVFQHTWNKQRIILTIAAAGAVDKGHLAASTTHSATLFHLDPSFDAALDHRLMLVSPVVFDQIASIVDTIDISGTRDLASLETLQPIADHSAANVSSEVAAVTITLAKATRDTSWPLGNNP